MTTQTQARNERGQFEKVEGPSIRLQFVPLWIGLAVAAAATILWGIRHASLGVALGLTVTAGALVLLVVRSRTDAGRAAATRAVAAAALWACLVATFGWSWLLTALGATVGALVSVPWWRAHYIPNTPASLIKETAPESVAVEQADAELVQDRWAKRVANTGTLAKSRLELVETNGRVHKLLVRLVPGKQKYAQLISAKEDIASAMEVPEACVIIERGPNAATGFLTIITDVSSPAPVMYPGPRFDPKTGLVGIGRYDDTDAEAFLSIIATNGAFGATFCGDQGSGKSAAMEQTAFSLLASGYFVGIYIDPQDGFSSPAMMKACKYRATNIEEAGRIIRQLPLLRRVRQAIFKQFGWNGYSLSRKHPVPLVFIDEFQEVANNISPDEQQTLVEMAKTFRKVGAAFLIGTQTIGLESFGGNSDLRAQLMSRNVVYFYTASKVQGRLSGDNEFDPSTLPEGTPGYGYLKRVRVDGELITRAAPFRAYHLGDKEDFGGRNPGVAWHERLRAEYEFAEWPDAEAGALAPALEDLEDDKAKAESEAALIAACEAVGRGESETAALNDYTSATPAKPQQQAAGEIEFASARIGGDPEDEQYPEKTQAILEALKAGAWRTAEIRRRSTIDVSTSHIEQTLPRLIEDGKAERIGTGHYHAVGYQDACEHPRCNGE